MNYKLVSVVLALALVGASRCTSLPYKDDLGFLVSAQADSPEFPLTINGKPCKDLDGILGLCTMRVQSNNGVRFDIDTQNYSYHLDVKCTATISSDFGVDVLKNSKYSFTIDPAKFSSVESFVCIGEVFPNDRPQPLSAKFEVRIKVVDAKYEAREVIYPFMDRGKNWLVLGEYARTAWVCDAGKCKEHSKDTAVEVSDPKTATAISQSYNMRYNSYGFDK